MMLPIIKTINYISPSALAMWNQCPQKFYLTRLAGYPYVEFPTSEAAACGIIFDAFIKDYLAKQFKITQPNLDLNTVLKNINLKEGCIEELIDKIRPVAVKYIELKFCQEILDSSEIYLEREFRADISSIPLLGKMDVVCSSIIDFKLRGFASKKPQHVYPGYSKAVHSGSFPLPQSPNKLMELTNKGWATQLFMYQIILQEILGRTLPMKIHEIVKTEHDFDIAEHIVELSNGFKMEIFKNLRELWSQVQSLNIDIPRPEPSHFRCNAYGVLCPVADKCMAFNNWFNTQRGEEKENERIY